MTKILPNLAYILDNSVQDYDWGDPDYIKDFLGNPNEIAAIQAEVWMGAHPKAPSKLFIGKQVHSLNALIAEDATTWLGKKALDLGWQELPFLFKLLAARKPLSIQAHPSLQRARQGFAEENAAGIPLSAGHRNFKDANHKPEIIIALSDFCGLCGFRAFEEIAKDLSWCAQDALEQEQKVAAELLTKLANTANLGDLAQLTQEILQVDSGLQELIGSLCRSAESRNEERFKLMLLAAEYFPADRGLLFFLVLEILQLKAGQSFFAPAGVLHAYIKGFGMELMANSDNVLRGGLTPKHIDVKELMTCLDVGAKAGLLEPVIKGDAKVYAAPVKEFCFASYQAEASFLTSHMGEIVLCSAGQGDLYLSGHGQEQSMHFSQGQAVYVLPHCSSVSLSKGLSIARAFIPG